MPTLIKLNPRESLTSLGDARPWLNRYFRPAMFSFKASDIDWAVSGTLLGIAMELRPRVRHKLVMSFTVPFLEE